ncbi:hypothetical protein FRC00_001599 [Tulasnella sp. 408]|nr:hypothetical protein FRC00_001599 [Tulasnella sp. 408]
MAFAPTRIDVGSIAVIAQLARTTTSVLASSFPPRNCILTLASVAVYLTDSRSSFASSPDNHGLTRTGLKAASDETSSSAVMDAIIFRLHNLSISEEIPGQATPAGDSVHLETSTPAESAAVGNSLGRKILKHKSKLFAKCAQSVRASFKRAAFKRATKKAGSASRPPFQCSSETDLLVGRIVDSISGRTVLAALEANRPHQVTRFREMFAFEVREPAVQWVGNTTFPPPTYLGIHHSNASPIVATVGDGSAGVTMEDIQQRPLSQPTSPEAMPMEVDAGTPSRNDALPLSSPQTPSESSIDSELSASVPSESTDTVMNDGDDVSSKTELPREFASKTLIDSLDGTPKVDVSQGRARTVAPTATATVAPLEGAPAQLLAKSPLAAATGVQPPTEVAENRETHATQRPVTPIQSGGSVSTPTATTTSNHPQPLPTPSPTATNSTTGPSTPTQSPQSRLTPEQGQPTQTHASRIHQVLGRWGLSKQASTPPQPADGEEAAEEAEAEAFFAKRMAAVRPSVKAKSKPEPLPSPSEPKPTKGSAARSLMDDIMTGFRGSTKPKSSRQQAPATAHSPTQSNPPATNVTRPSLAIQRTLPVVAGRRPGPQATSPCHVETGPEAIAPGGSMIPSEAPSAVSTISKVNGARVGNPNRVGVSSEAALPEPTVESSGAAMDGVESGRRVVKGSRRVARAIAMTGWTWENTQQKALQAQAAQDLENNVEAAPAAPSSLRAFEERARSSAWHAVQPPPPSEAIPYVDVGGKFRRGARKETSG